MKNVLMICKYQHDLDYFKAIKNYIDSKDEEDIKVDLLFNLPLFFVEFFLMLKSFSISQEEIAEAILSEVKRKKAKYSPFISKLYIIWFYFLARLYFIKYFGILKNGKYDVLCLWGGYNAFQRMAILAAKKLNIKVYHFENGSLPNTTVMDSKGTNYNNSVPRERSFYSNVEINFIPEPLIPRDKLPPKPVTVLPKRYIFCPFQVELDNQILINSPWIENMFQFYEVIEELAKHAPEDVFFIIKAHPNCKQDYSNLYKKNNPKILFANSNSTEDLIKNAEFIITINSTVGIEGIMKNKKVITLGNAYYSGYGFAKDARSVDQILYLLGDDMWETDEEENLKFLSFLQNIYFIQGSWKSPTKEHMEEIYRRLKL